ncbi:alpha/beta fold hydrolase [Mucilaginibacter terrenus]|uniref:Alpha/beta fold hydrolase n=1 Tax=Mucilaginibacter terrenus TaxID=2482727 RepID=A0A3E2NYJ6_9SPHI|nr:alpha/beta fold hydrolase [Mucilaginibacter terrenus]RFZ86073.1 alpha/beta fold hydrolase [Mucilaginibacter terrenus]
MNNYNKKAALLKRFTALVIIAMMSLGVFASCSKNDDDVKTVKTFVLIHGAWQGAWVWQNVQAGLVAAGHKVIVVELPGHGEDKTPPATLNLNAYRDKVVAAINGVSGKVVLVGHSMGGMVITSVAEVIPNKIEKLVYIGAFLPATGQSLGDLAGTDAQSLLGPNIIPSADQLTLDIKRDQVVNIFCQDGPASVQAQVNAMFRVEPAIPFGDKVTITAANFGAVDKYYIHTLLDHAVGIDLQNRMAKAAGITKQYNLNSGHCPFLSMPEQVTLTLLTITK